MDDLFKDTTFGRRALQKLAPVADNFMIYDVECIGTGKAGAWRCTGAEFREAKRGPRKGERCVLVPGTTRVAIVSYEEVAA